MNIGLCHFRVGEIDGVSLEMDKWKAVLKQMGHQVFYIAGSKGNSEALIVEGLHYKNERNNQILINAYSEFNDFNSVEEFETEVLNYATEIENAFIEVIRKYKIDLIVPNNIFSLGWNLSAAIGIFNACTRMSVKILCHHHDFYWERKKYSSPTNSFVKKILDSYFPVNNKLVQHVVINHIAKKELLDRKGIESVVVPNVFDFELVDWKIDDFNKKFRTSIEVKDADIIFLQATRIVERKGIELAIDVVAEVNKRKNELIGKILHNGQTFYEDNSIWLVFTNLNESEAYYSKLLNYADTRGVKIKDVNHLITHSRTEGVNKTYSLWDAYLFADIVCYPSILEGWGNQFLEALVARKPIVVYEYPVFETDIKPKGFNVISLGNKYSRKDDTLVCVKDDVLERASSEIIVHLTNQVKREKNVNENFDIGLRELSYRSLHSCLKKILDN